MVTRILRNFLASGEESKTYEDLTKSKDYICYVLKKPSINNAATSDSQP